MRLQAKEKQRAIVDLFIFRFSRLQEVMGAKIFHYLFGIFE